MQTIQFNKKLWISDEILCIDDELVVDASSAEVQDQVVARVGETRSVQSELSADVGVRQADHAAASATGGMKAVVEEDGALDVQAVSIQRGSDLVGEYRSAEAEFTCDVPVDEAYRAQVASAGAVGCSDKGHSVDVDTVGVQRGPGGIGHGGVGQIQLRTNVRTYEPGWCPTRWWRLLGTSRRERRCR